MVIKAPEPIRIWNFHEAPEHWRKLSPHGGDEDWLAYIPKGYDYYIPWMQEGTSFGCCSVSEHVLNNGDIIRIGAHA